MKIKRQSIVPPQWFLDCQKYLEKIRDDSAKILGVGGWWLESQDHKHLDLVKDFNLKPDEVRKFQLLQKSYNGLAELMWAKFRLDNLENEWGKSITVKFDREKKKLVMYESIFKVIQETISKIYKEYAEAIRHI